jgi:hypothetical protein
MKYARGLAVWLVPPLLASFALTAIVQIATGGQLSGNGLRVVGWLAITTLLFTVPGSALLSLAFAWAESRGLPLLGRYVALIALGAIAGSLAMTFGTSTAVIAGCLYGTATAVIWVALHRTLYRKV